jgi:hypothetical protein
MKSVKLGVILSILILSGALSAKDTSEQNASKEADVKGPVSVEWVKPEDFRDVRHPSVSKAKYREQVFAKLETHFDKLAEDLPEGYHLALKVTNLDMAGEVQTATQAGLIGMHYRASASFQEYRIMRDIDIPRMTFSFELRNADGQIVQSEEEVKLKDVGFLNRTSTRFKNRPLKYEKAMVSRWFKETFLAESEA